MRSTLSTLRTLYMTKKSQDPDKPTVSYSPRSLKGAFKIYVFVGALEELSLNLISLEKGWGMQHTWSCFLLISFFSKFSFHLTTS